jgi:hypothetical protein
MAGNIEFALVVRCLNCSGRIRDSEASDKPIFGKQEPDFRHSRIAAGASRRPLLPRLCCWATAGLQRIEESDLICIPESLRGQPIYATLRKNLCLFDGTE